VGQAISFNRLRMGATYYYDYPKDHGQILEDSLYLDILENPNEVWKTLEFVV